ncbi:MAG: DUF58 domain-containing protein [Armatimonadetes bacterium]|nr:DUF58 domain-containing protein [Armatimonadota bacterium]
MTPRQRKWVAAGLTGALLIALLVLGGYWAFVFYVAAGIAFVSWLMTFRAANGVEVTRLCDRREAKIGEAVSVRVRLTNRGVFPVPWLMVEDMVLPELPASGLRGELTWLMPGRDLVLEYRLHCTRRGYYRIGPLLIETGDHFGIFRRFMARPPLHYLTVYPRALPIGRLLVPTSRPIGEVRQQFALLEDPMRPAGVREYMRGDPLRRIHWKATAHTGRLHSRVYDRTRVQGANIVVDFHRDAWPAESENRRELAITIAASLAAHLRDRNQRFGLISNGLDGAKMIEAWPAEVDAPSRARAAEILGRREPPQRFEPVVVPAGRGDETLELVMGALARLAPGYGLTIDELIAREHPAWSRELAILLVVPSVSESLLPALGILRAARFAVGVIVTGDPSPRAAMLSEAGVAVWMVPSEEAIQSIAI